MHFVVGVITETDSLNEVEAALEKFYVEIDAVSEIDQTKAEFIVAEREKYREMVDSEDYKEYLRKKLEKESAPAEQSLANESAEVVPNDPMKTYSNRTDEIYEKLPDALQMDDENFYQFAKEHHGLPDKYFDAEGNLVNWYNPDGQYDWYVVGGRWENTMRLKNGEMVNTGQLSNIDFRPNKETMDFYRKSWEACVDGKKFPDSEGIHPMMRKEEMLAKYQTIDNYIECHIADNLPARFVTPDGVWHDTDTGWDWQTQKDTTLEYDHKQEFIDFLTNNGDLYMTIVDCHI